MDGRSLEIGDNSEVVEYLQANGLDILARALIGMQTKRMLESMGPLGTVPFGFIGMLIIGM